MNSRFLRQTYCRRPGRPVSHRFVTCCCSLAHMTGKEEQNVCSLRCHCVRDGYKSDESAVYHSADARRQTRTVTLTRTDNSESINLSWLSWEFGTQQARRWDEDKILEVNNKHFFFFLYNSTEFWSIFFSVVCTNTGRFIHFEQKTSSDCLWRKFSWTSPWGSNSPSNSSLEIDRGRVRIV